MIQTRNKFVQNPSKSTETIWKRYWDPEIVLSILIRKSKFRSIKSWMVMPGPGCRTSPAVGWVTLPWNKSTLMIWKRCKRSNSTKPIEQKCSKKEHGATIRSWFDNLIVAAGLPKFRQRRGIVRTFQISNLVRELQIAAELAQFAKTNSVPLYPLKISQPGNLKVLYTPVRSILPNTAHMASYSSAGLLFTAFKPRINELLIKLLTNWVNPQLDFGIRNTLTLFPSSDIDKIPCLPLRWNHRNHDGQGSFFRGGWKDADGNSGRHHRRSSIYRLK